MRPAARRRSSRILILGLLCVTVAFPVIYFDLTPLDLTPAIARKDLFGFEIPGIVRSFTPVQKKSTDAVKLESIEQEIGEGLREPTRQVLVEEKGNGNASAADENGGSGLTKSDATKVDIEGAELRQHYSSISPNKKKQGLSNRTAVREIHVPSVPIPVAYKKIREMEDQLILAKAYLQFSPPNSNSHLVKELKLRMKDIERVLGHASRDLDLSKTALQRMKAMSVTLSKANKAYPDCSAMASKLQAMTHATEDQLREHEIEASFLTQIATRTFPKGLHCLSLRLTTEYFNLKPEARELPNKHKAKNLELYHYAVFSDNVLACAVVVNSTISTSMEPEKIAFHVVTDSLNFPAMMMWFLLNPPGEAAMDIENLDDFKWLPSGYNSMFKQAGVRDRRYISTLNHLRFYLPEIYPYLNKILFLDHDVVVQRDLRELWSVDMKGKVNGAVELCRKGDPSHRLKTLINFSDPTVAKEFHPQACIWAYGMNLFDLLEWRRLRLTSAYLIWLEMGKRRQLYKVGSLPMGQITFYNHTTALDRRWHMLGLGHDPNIRDEEIEKASVIHYEGYMKPWLEIGIPKYRAYWSKFLDYDHPYLQKCNIHG